MNRRILIQVATPAVLIGFLLLGASLVGVWYINRLQANLASILSENVTSLRAAQDLEIRARQLRFHCFLYLIAPTPGGLQPIEEDNTGFINSLNAIRQQLDQQRAHSAKEQAFMEKEQTYLQAIEDGYQQYHAEMTRLQTEVQKKGPRKDYLELSAAHPIRHVVDPCRQWLQLNETMMAQTSQHSADVSRRARLAMLLLGLVGPSGGLIIGYGVARGLSRSIYELSVRVQGISQRLEEDVASVSISANGDIQSLDQQLQHVVRRVEEVAEHLQQHQRDMLRAEQLSAVGQLAAGVAHEIRNPLTSVKMLVEAALRHPDHPSLTAEDLQVIHGEVVRLEQTVQSFLDFARPPAPHRHTCDLREILTQAVELTRARARLQGVNIGIHAPEEPVPAFVDPGQFRTVLVNLLINALDAMPGGGRLDIDLEMSPTGIRLTVADSGPGIAPEMVARLFMPFASTKATGTGLGLSISRRILEEHGGRIDADNRLEGGARFTITLPRKKG